MTDLQHPDSSFCATDGLEAPNMQLLSTFSHFEEIHCSGFNRIVRAQRYGQYFVLKALRPEFVDNPLFRQLLNKEFSIAIRMEHPNIVRAYGLEEVEGLGPCIVMGYVDGLPLDKFLEEKPSARIRRRVMSQLLSAMEYYHSLQVVHRDLKPSNVLVTRNGNDVKVIDFGLADTDYYAVLKTPAYSIQFASPEQISGGLLDQRSDIYSFGRILGMVFPHSYRVVRRRCCARHRSRRYPDAAAVQFAMFNPWHWALRIMLLILLLAGTFFGCRWAFPRNTGVFEVAVPGGTICCRVDDCQAYVAKGGSVSGPLYLPAEVSYRLRTYPVICIDAEAFIANHAITSLTLPEGLRRVEHDAFAACNNLGGTLVIPKSVEFIGTGAFAACAITRVELHCSSCRTDERYVFLGCEHLRVVDVTSDVDTLNCILQSTFLDSLIIAPNVLINNSALASILELHHLVLPSHLERLNCSTFWSAGIDRIVLPETIDTVEGWNFRHCRAHYVEMGPRVTYLGPSCMANMVNLDTVVLRAIEPPALGNVPFEETDVSRVRLLVPASSVEAYKSHPEFGRLRVEPLPEK